MYLLYLIKVLTQLSLVQSLCAAYCNYDKSLLASFKLKTGYIGKWVKLWISQLHHRVLFIYFFLPMFFRLADVKIAGSYVWNGAIQWGSVLVFTFGTAADKWDESIFFFLVWMFKPRSTVVICNKQAQKTLLFTV